MHIHWSWSDSGFLEARTVGLADSEGWSNARAGSCHSSSTVVGVTCCSSLEDTAEAELEKRNDEECREMHDGGLCDGIECGSRNERRSGKKGRENPPQHATYLYLCSIETLNLLLNLQMLLLDMGRSGTSRITDCLNIMCCPVRN